MSHVPVMAGEVVHYLVHADTRLVLDGTVGCGGHARAILEAGPAVELIGVDSDREGLKIAERELAPYGSRVRLIEGDYTDLSRITAGCGKLDGALLDLGISSLQLDDPSRGFSYLREGPLDMRMSGTGSTAEEFIGRASEMDLARVLRRYGEVTGASRIARAIKRASVAGGMRSTSDLRDAVDSTFGGKAAPALLSKVFQAIRISVNHELDNLKQFLGSILGYLDSNARLVIVSYHSLEDKTVKVFFKHESRDCICPPAFPVCTCGHRASLEVLTRRVVKPTTTEVMENSRARSANLRAARVIPGDRREKDNEKGLVQKI